MRLGEQPGGRALCCPVTSVGVGLPILASSCCLMAALFSGKVAGWIWNSACSAVRVVKHWNCFLSFFEYSLVFCCFCGFDGGKSWGSGAISSVLE